MRCPHWRIHSVSKLGDGETHFICKKWVMNGVLHQVVHGLPPFRSLLGVQRGMCNFGAQ